MNATSQTTTEVSADDMDSLQTGDVISVSYESNQGGERSFEAEVTDTDLTRMDAGEHGMVLIGSVTMCRTVTDKTGDPKANDDFPRRRLQASAGSLTLKSRSTTINGAVWSKMSAHGSVTVTQTEETETDEPEDDDEDAGSRDAFSSCLNCSTETDDTFCEDCSPDTDGEEADDEDEPAVGEADDSGTRPAEDEDPILMTDGGVDQEPDIWETANEADRRLLGDADDPAAAYAEGEDFEAYHVRSTASGIRSHGLDQQRRKSAETHYDGLVPAALRFLADEEVSR